MRRGVVLLVVVVVVAMLSLAGLSFVAMVQTEHKSIRLQGEELQLEQVLGSGDAFLKTFLDQPHEAQDAAGGTADNPERFRDAVVFEDRPGGPSGRFSILSLQGEEQSSGPRYGLENESAKLSLASLPLWEQREPGAGRRALLALPGMTEAVADAILDWVDGDDVPRTNGAEAEHYAGTGLPYGPRNAPPQCLEELLLVRGVTREMLFGPDEGLARPIDRPSPGLRAGLGSNGTAVPWAKLLTVAAAERNWSYDGRPRIDLNQNDPAELYRLLEERTNPEWAQFIVSYRQYGPYEGDEPTDSQAALSFDPSLPVKTRIDSPLELIGARLRIPSPDGKTGKVFASPLAADPAAMRQYLPRLLDCATAEDAPVLVGRVNLNLAPREVLRAVPGMDEGLAEQVLAARGPHRDDPERRCPAWPLIEGLVDRVKMKALLPYLTTGGDVYRGRIVARMDGLRRSLAADIVIDASRSPPRQVYWKDLRLLRRTGFQPVEP